MSKETGHIATRYFAESISFYSRYKQEGSSKKTKMLCSVFLYVNRNVL